MMPSKHGDGVRCGRRLVLAMALALWVPAAASAAGGGDAEGYVGELAQEAIALSRSGPDGQAGRLEQLLDRSTDIALVGRLVLGRYWRTASAEQRKDYLELFRGYVLAGITRRLGGSNGVEKVEVTGSRPGRGQDSMVATLVTLGNGAAPSPIEWRVRRTGDGYRIVLEFYLDDRAALDAKYEELTGYGYVGHCAPNDVTPRTRFAMVDDPDGNTILLSAFEPDT